MKKAAIITVMAVALLAGTLAPTATQALTVRREAIQSARCTVAEARIQVRINRVSLEKTHRMTTYDALQAKIDTMIKNADEKGYDTTELIAARTSVQEAIGTYTKKASAYAEALQTTKDYACGESDGAFASALTDARSALAETRRAAVDVHSTFRVDVVPALKDYVSWLEAQK